MAEKLAELGVRIERGVELVGFRDRGDCIELTLKHGDTTVEHSSASYLLGCDGAHSRVRELLHLGFEGKTFPGAFLLADLHIDWDMPDEQEFYIFTSSEGLVPIFNLGGGISRLVADIPQGQAGDKPSLEECQRIVDRRLAQRLRLSDLRWSSYFHINSRRVEKLRVGRVFVAGDAAHIHSPAAGQGMNTGIQEAINLAWKVALVMHGQAGDGLLNTYDKERRPVEKDIIARTDTLFRMASAQGGILAFLRDRVVPLIGNAEPVQRLITDFVSELGIEYRSSSLTLSEKRNGSPQPGNRAPDATVSVTSGPREWRSEARIFDLIDPAKFTLLLFDARSPAGVSGNDQAAAALSEALPQAVNIWHVTDPSDSAVATPYGTERPSFCLIRPDGYVMLRGTPADADSAAKFCRRLFTRASI